MRNLDAKSWKILYELDINSRQSYHQIAKKVGLSKDAVIYRIKQMENEGIITKYRAIIDVGKLGYISFRLYLKLNNATPEKESEIIEYLKSQRILGWMVSVDGHYDLNTWFLVKSVKEMNDFWKELLKRYVNYISERWLTIFTRVTYFSRAYFVGKEENDIAQVFITEPQELSIDSADWKILELLSRDARMPVVDIAKQVGLTARTVIMRIRDLEKKKIIIGYRTNFDLSKLGYQYFKVHFNLHNVIPEKLRALKEYIFRHPNVVYDNEVLGGDDIEIEIQVKTLPELRAIINEIKERFSDMIKDYHHMLYFKEHKFVSLPDRQ